MPRASRSPATTASSSRSTCWPRSLAQQDGGTASLLQRAGVKRRTLRKAVDEAIARLPKVEGTGGEITVSRDLNNLLNLTDKEATRRGDQFIAIRAVSCSWPRRTRATPAGS